MTPVDQGHAAGASGAAAASGAADVAGEVFGSYRVHERLGVGGMATVHRATALGIAGFRRVVALKRLLPHLGDDPQVVRAFVGEAKLASLLQHPNIVQIVELGRLQRTYFIAMEYVRGCDLRAILRAANRVGQPPPVPVTLTLIGQLLDALEYAHDFALDGRPLGIVHRDVSPSNLLIADSGHLKVIDFGIARAHGGPGEGEGSQRRGKLAYVAPEVLRGTVDRRADVFAAGVVAHELLTARPLFAARGQAQTLERLWRLKVPPPSRSNPAVPEAIDSIVLRALARDPAQRTPTAGEMRDALADVVDRLGLVSSSRDVAAYLRELATSGEPMRPRAAVDAADERATRRVPTTHTIRRRSPFSTGPDLARGTSPEREPRTSAPSFADASVAGPLPDALAAFAERAAQAADAATAAARSRPLARGAVLASTGALASPPPPPPARNAHVLRSPVAAAPVRAPVSLAGADVAPWPPLRARGSTPVPAHPNPALAPPPAPAPVSRVLAQVAPGRAARPRTSVFAVAAFAAMCGFTLALPLVGRVPVAARAPLATLRVEVEPAAAVVVIDGMSGAATRELPPGVHTVAVRHPGHVAWRDRVAVKAGKTHSIKIEMVRRSAAAKR